MDPNQSLLFIRRLAAKLQSQEWMHTDTDIAGELAIAFQDLDGWLCHGGFLPTAWKRDYSSEEAMENEGGICD